MQLLNELAMLLRSDVSANGIADLVSRDGLWIRNSMIHIGAGFVGWFWALHKPGARVWLHGAFAAYALLQVVQMFSGGSALALAIDGVWDLLSIAIGRAGAMAIAIAPVKRERQP